MRKMIKYLGAALAGLAAVLTAGCTASRYAASASPYYDNMYGTHDRQAIAQAERRQAEIEQAEAEARRAGIEAMLAQADAEDGIILEGIDDGYSDSYIDGYRDGYESAYLRRLSMFEDPYYVRPSSYYDYYYDTAFFVDGVYGPGFYDISIVGGNVIVNPVYLTPWSYWSSPYYWNPGFYFGSYYSPYWGWSWGSTGDGVGDGARTGDGIRVGGIRDGMTIGITGIPTTLTDPIRIPAAGTVTARTHRGTHHPHPAAHHRAAAYVPVRPHRGAVPPPVP